MSTQFFWLLALSLLVCPTAASAQPITGTVAGKVTFRGRPLAEGTITFIARSSKMTGTIQADGRYRVSGIPTGPAFIQVKSRGLTVPPADKPGKSMPLPFTVRPGSQQHNIDLK